MNCEKHKLLLGKYLDGELSTAEEKNIQDHLDSCHSCQQMLDDKMTESEATNIKPSKGSLGNSLPPTLENKKQSRILLKAKYKHRFITAIFVICLFILFQIVGGFVSSLYYNSGGENSRLYKTQKTALLLTEFNLPNVQIPVGMHSWPTFFTGMGSGHSSLEIKPYLAARGSYTLQKTIGKKTYPVGSLNINYLLSAFTTKWDWEGGSHQTNLFFNYPHPTELFTPDTIPIGTTEAWKALDMLPEGTVAELAVSFDRKFSLSQVNTLLDDYDLNVTWYAISTGVEGDNPYSDNRRPVLSAFNGAWGFGYMSHMMRSQYPHINLDDPAQQEDYFLTSMGYLAQNEKLAQKIYRGNWKDLRLPERVEYLQQNGIQVYGVVLTGPTKELLRLQDLETVRFAALGEIELWNWFHPSFNANLY